jgi:hypothetical protein
MPSLHTDFPYGVGLRSDCQLGGRSSLDPLTKVVSDH